MFRMFLAATAALLLASCGGGGPLEDVSVAGAPQAAAGRQSLVSWPAALVHADTAGEQALRGLGATSDGGYAIAWISGAATLYVQHHDRFGAPQGPAVHVPLVVPDAAPTAAQQAVAFADVAVLADGSIVVAYRVDRPTLLPNGTVSVKTGLYLQRFDRTGALLLGETEIASREEVIHSRSPILSHPMIVALSDGSFVVSWTLANFSAQFGAISTLSFRRYDAQAQPLGDAVEVGHFPALGHALHPDAHGGFVLTLTQLDASFTALTSLMHVAADGSATLLADPRPGAALALPLSQGWLLFTSSDAGALLQRLDPSGQPSGAARPFPAVPRIARELSDGSFVAVWEEGGTLQAQRFSAEGDRLGLPVAASAPPTAMLELAALPDAGFVLAWSQPGAAGLDVFRQPFEVAPQGLQKACRDAAKALHGREHQRFMQQCRKSGA